MDATIMLNNPICSAKDLTFYHSNKGESIKGGWNTWGRKKRFDQEITAAINFCWEFNRCNKNENNFRACKELLPSPSPIKLE